MQEDERRDEMRHGAVGLHGQAVQDNATTAAATTAAAEPPAKTAAPSGDDGDGDFDMFADDFDDDKYLAGNPLQNKQQQATTAANAPADGALLEGDDTDGYYKIRPGELLDRRYQLQVALGKGMYSGVAQAVDVTNNRLVAVKMMRNNDALRKGGLTEIAILEKLNAADPDDRKHIIRFQRHFDFKGHLCLAFEHMSMNLREVLRKFGNNVGINMDATRAYAQQIFVALAHMRRNNIIHTDLKPDNILVNEKRNVVKICDLGTAIDRGDAATAQVGVSPYLVSRFYRAPELILGMSFDYGIDMWSVGCTLYELYTGKILFTGNSNNQMLRAIMETRGKIMPKLYKKGELWAAHFDDMGRFRSMEVDKYGKVCVFGGASRSEGAGRRLADGGR
jgi:serine/threonine-protein kinase PRP4